MDDEGVWTLMMSRMSGVHPFDKKKKERKLRHNDLGRSGDQQQHFDDDDDDDN